MVAHTTPAKSAKSAHPRTATGAREVPRHPGGALGLLRGLNDDPLAYMRRVVDHSGDFARINYFGRKVVFIRDPDGAHDVLVRNARDYSKQTGGYTALRRVLGLGLVTSEGEFWKRQRRIAQPAFHRRRIAALGDTMTHAAQTLLPGWQARIDHGMPIEIDQEMMRLTLRIVCKTLLDVDVQWDMDRLERAIHDMQHWVAVRTRHPLHWPEFVPTPGNRRFRRALATLDEAVGKIIAERRASGEDKGDLLSMFMLTCDAETGERMSDQQLRDEVLTMFLAGHETTAMNLTWTLHLLANHPRIQAQVQAELDEVIGRRPATAADLRHLPLLGRVIQESLRLYPPVPVVARMCEAQNTVAGYRIPKGSYVVVSPYLIHRHPGLWPDPDRFDPERFADGAGPRHRLALLPFSAGSRKCIGDRFAEMEAQLVLATLLSGHTFRPVPGRGEIGLEPLISLRPRGGLALRVRPRAER